MSIPSLRYLSLQTYSVSQIPEFSDVKLIDSLVDVNAVRLHIFFFKSFRFISCFFARASGGAAALRFGLDAGVAARVRPQA